MSEGTQATEPTEPGRAEEVATGGAREDDRNEAAGSPVPDPTADDTGADDVPDAD